MTKPFEIEVKGDTLRATLRGYWDLATAGEYTTQLLLAAKSVRAPQPYWLLDLIDFPIQAAEVAGRLAPGVAAAKAVNPPIVALVVNSALAAMQARRVGQDMRQTRFTTRAAAEEWLRVQAAA